MYIYVYNKRRKAQKMDSNAIKFDGIAALPKADSDLSKQL